MLCSKTPRSAPPTLYSSGTGFGGGDVGVRPEPPPVASAEPSPLAVRRDRPGLRAAQTGRPCSTCRSAGLARPVIADQSMWLSVIDGRPEWRSDNLEGAL